VKGKNFLLFGVLSAVAYAAYKSSQVKENLKYLHYDINRLRFNLKNILKPEIIIAVELFNPNSITIPVTDFFGQIKAGSDVLAHFKNLQAVNVPPRSSTQFEVSTKVSALGLLYKIIKGQSFATIDITGQMQTALYSLPLQKSINIKEAISGMPVKRKPLKQPMASWSKRKLRQRPKAGFLQYGYRGNFSRPVLQSIV
jgi:LEA14-like dessication related protein